MGGGDGKEKHPLKVVENMEGKEIIELSNLIEKPEICLHAIAGSPNPKTIRVKGRIGLRWITIVST